MFKISRQPVLQVTWDGRVLCWGNNSSGQCGLPRSEAAFVSEPTYVELPIACQSVVQISSGFEHVGCISRSGKILCWGNNDSNQLGASVVSGPGSSYKCEVARGSLPVCIMSHSLLAGFSQVACGGNHTVALCNDCEVFAWGFNAYGQCGPGDNNLNEHRSTVRVEDLRGKKVSQVRAGANFTLAVCHNGNIVCVLTYDCIRRGLRF